MATEDTAKITPTEEFEWAVHFFRLAKHGLQLCYRLNSVTTQPSPTKLIPRSVRQDDGSHRLETSVILHKGEFDVPWDVSCKLYNSQFAYGGIDIVTRQIEKAKLSLERKQSQKSISKFHANIIGWDADDDTQQQQAILLLKGAVARIHQDSQEKHIEFVNQKLLEYKACGKSLPFTWTTPIVN